MKKLIAATALAVSLSTQAEVIELTFNSAILTYATESTDDVGKFTKRLNESVTFASFNDSRERGRRSVSTTTHQSIVEGYLELGVNRRTLRKTITVDATWSPEAGKNCQFSKSIEIPKLPMKYESQESGCNFYLAVKRVNPMTGTEN